MEEIDAASVEGGAGNDTIFLNDIESAVGGDALTAHATSTDGKDSIVLNGTMSASTICGGGNDASNQHSEHRGQLNYINR